MSIPGIVSGSEVSTPSAAIQLNPQPFRQAALAKGQGAARVASAIGQDVGGLGFDVSQKFQQNRNAQTIFKADYAMRQTKQQFDDWRLKNPDPMKWGPQYDQMTQQTTDDIMNGPNVGPDLKRQLSMMTANWKQSTSGEVNTAAQLQTINDTTKSAVLSATLAAQQGQLSSAYAIADHNVAVGGWDKTQGDNFKATLKPVAEQAQIANASQVNPWQAIQDLKAGKWDSIKEETRNAEIVRAQRILNQQMTQTYQDIRAKRDNGTIFTQDQLNQLVDQHKLLASSVDPILKQQAGEVKQHDIETGKAAVQDMLAKIPQDASDHDRVAATTKILASPEYLSLPEAIKKQFDPDLKKTARDAQEENVIHRRTMDNIQRDFPYGHDDATNLMSAKASDDMEKWFKQNPEASFEDAEKAKERIFAPIVTAQTQRTLAGNSPTKNVTPEQYRKLRPGQLFWYNGKQIPKE